jgi:hypothetical protein
MAKKPDPTLAHSRLSAARYALARLTDARTTLRAVGCRPAAAAIARAEKSVLGAERNALRFAESFADSQLARCLAQDGYDVREPPPPARPPADARTTLDKIVRELSGEEWNADTLDTIAIILRHDGYDIADVR